MVSTFEVDINCPYCFDDIISALRRQPTVTEVRGSMTTGCVSVTHATVESRLGDVITDIGHRVEVARNGEIVQGRLNAAIGHTCRVER